MVKKKIYRLLPLGLLVAITLTLGHGRSLAQMETTATAVGQSTSGPTVLIFADPDGDPGEAVPPPASLARYYAQQSDGAEIEGVTAVAFGNIQVTFKNGCTINGNTYNAVWPTEAQVAFQYAIDIWNSLLLSNAPILIEAEWCPLDTAYNTTGILGAAGATTLWVNPGGVCENPAPNTFYSAAQTNLLCEQDILNGNEVSAQFNSERNNWHFDTTTTPGIGEYDFVSVVLHEIGHGLGFFGSMQSDGIRGYWGYTASNGSVYPVIYDRFAETGGGTPLLNFASGSTTLNSILTSNSVYFDSPLANSSNDSNRVKLYAPNPWRPGSSYAHVDTIFDNTNNALMTYSLAPREVQHDPGPITLAMFKDMHFKIETYPILADLPATLLVEQNTTNNNLLNLAAYYSDADTEDVDLNVDVQSSVGAAGVVFDGTYIDVNPDTNFIGTTTVTVTVTDVAGLTATGSFNVVVAESLAYTYLPVLVR